MEDPCQLLPMPNSAKRKKKGEKEEIRFGRASGGVIQAFIKKVLGTRHSFMLSEIIGGTNITVIVLFHDSLGVQAPLLQHKLRRITYSCAVSRTFLIY